jgi:hypothetical protein
MGERWPKIPGRNRAALVSFFIKVKVRVDIRLCLRDLDFPNLALVSECVLLA